MSGADKIVVVINGRGGVGKDTLCGFAAEEYPVMNVSSITPVKQMAAMAGWSGEKTDAARRFLAELKRLTVEYCDYPTRWLVERYREFALSSDRIMFVHIREGGEIEKFARAVRAEGAKVLTLLITRGKARSYGNLSDDNVENYSYDLTYTNERPIEEARADFLNFLRKNILAEE